MAEFETIRPINLPQSQEVYDNDVFVIDSVTGGVRKIPKDDVITKIDDTLTETGQAADAKSVGDELDTINDTLDENIPLIQNPTKTVSGSIAHFTDGADMPAKSVIVNIEPVQSGTGTPSPDNVRQISGWESVNLFDTGVNVWDEEWELGSYNSETGAKINNTTRIRTANKIPCKGGTTYYFKVGVNGTYGTMCYYDASETFISSYSFTGNATFTPPNNACYCAWTILGYGTTYNNDISINYPSTDTDYHAYTGTTATIPLGRTVYGGTLDVVSGVLTVDRVMVGLGTLTWGLFTGACYRAVLSNFSGGAYNSDLSKFLSTALSPKVRDAGWSAMEDWQFGVYDTYIVVAKSDTTASDLKTALNGVQLVYPLVSPQTYQLTPTEVKTILGENNVWADAGSVEVTYRRDINLALEQLEQAIISLGSNV